MPRAPFRVRGDVDEPGDRRPVAAMRMRGTGCDRHGVPATGRICLAYPADGTSTGVPAKERVTATLPAIALL